MGKFERSREGKKDYRNSSKKRKSRFSDSEDGPRGRRSFGDSPRGRKFSDRGPRDRRAEKTRVTCSSCGDKCEVPFKPTSGKPVYCSNCFANQDNQSSGKASSKGLDIINEKLDKIMEALDIQ